MREKRTPRPGYKPISQNLFVTSTPASRSLPVPVMVVLDSFLLHPPTSPTHRLRTNHSPAVHFVPGSLDSSVRSTSAVSAANPPTQRVLPDIFGSSFGPENHPAVHPTHTLSHNSQRVYFHTRHPLHVSRINEVAATHRNISAFTRSSSIHALILRYSHSG